MSVAAADQQTAEPVPSKKRFPFPLVDCDVHQGESSPQDIIKRMPGHFASRGLKLLNRAEYPNPFGGGRNDMPHDHGHPTNDPKGLAHAHLDEYGIDFAILTGNKTRIGCMPDLDYAAAIARAYNEYVEEVWLTSDKRYYGAITIAPQDPAQAAAEIRRSGQNPRMTSVVLNSATTFPLGNRFYHPIYEAAEELGLPVSIHPGGEGTGMAHPPTPNGYPTTYLEWHTNLSQGYMAQACSLVCEGVFVKFPKLKFVCIEGGISWLPHLMWRLDKNWKALRDTVPWLTRLPSEYMVDHLRFTTQPIEEAPNPKDLLEIMRIARAEKTLMFSSDYAHWDFDCPVNGLPKFPDAWAPNIFYKTARDTYRWPDGTWDGLDSDDAGCPDKEDA